MSLAKDSCGEALVAEAPMNVGEAPKCAAILVRRRSRTATWEPKTPR